MTFLNIEIDDELKSIEVKKIGAGMFAIAYEALDFTFPGFVNPIILVSKFDNEYSKEVMCHVSGDSLFPIIETLGYDKTDKKVYIMEKYKPLKKADATPDAWKNYQLLNKAWKKFLYSGRRLEVEAYAYNNDIIDDLPDGELKESVQNLESWAGAYGSDYAFEFNKGNLALDNNGNLILRDPVFSVKAMKKIRNN